MERELLNDSEFVPLEDDESRRDWGAIVAAPLGLMMHLGYSFSAMLRNRRAANRQARDAQAARGQAAKNQGPVRDRLVTGYTDHSGHGVGPPGLHRSERRRGAGAIVGLGQWEPFIAAVGGGNV